ncbi:MAG TPA: arylesterase [Stellaceae bacterium]|jgi:acyl-CoA thioesterase-1|nr:arylesterase [Stellaceae bacterium]
MVVALALLLTFPSAAATAAAPTRLLVFGDSLAAGYGLAPDQAFPARLGARLAAEGLPVKIINAGVSGDTSADGLARLDWVMDDHPDVVLLELGANDALRGIDPKLTFANLDGILAKLEASRVKVLLIGMLAPPNWGRDYQRDFDSIYRRLAAKYRVPLYPFLLDGVAMDPALNQADGLHPNAKGAAIIAEKLAPVVARLLQGGGG